MKVLAALDLSYIDKFILNFLRSHHSKIGSIEKILCLYVDKNPDIPDDIKELLDVEYDEKRFRQLLKEEFDQEGNGELLGKYELIMDEGSLEERMMHHADSNEVDLVVLGHKPRTDGTGIRARRLACQTDANVLFCARQEKGLEEDHGPCRFFLNCLLKRF